MTSFAVAIGSERNKTNAIFTCNRRFRCPVSLRPRLAASASHLACPSQAAVSEPCLECHPAGGWPPLAAAVSAGQSSRAVCLSRAAIASHAFRRPTARLYTPRTGVQLKKKNDNYTCNGRRLKRMLRCNYTRSYGYGPGGETLKGLRGGLPEWGREDLKEKTNRRQSGGGTDVGDPRGRTHGGRGG